MTRQQEAVAAVVLTLFSMFCAVQFVKAQAAKARVLAMDQAEIDFYQAMDKQEGLKALATKTIREAYAWEKPSTAGRKTGS